MSEPASGSESERPSSGERPRAGSTGALRQPALHGVSPVLDDQPTVISHRPPLATLPRPQPDADAKPDDIPPGARLGHFELLEYVGGGGMGRVFRALDTRLGRAVALKVLSRDQAADMATLMRFRNEARSAARLNHEGIAQVYFVGEEQGLPFIAFEFVEGINVRDLVAQEGPLPLGKALSYTLQVAEALAHAASRSVVHRDIKPSNVLITSDGRAKLIDLGLARMQKISASANDLTASGVTLGTFDYISPEQARDPRHADARSDIYSLGCTLFYMLTGRPPFPEGTVLQKLLQHQGIDPPDVRQFRPDLPEEVSRVLWKMMAKEPRRRYQDPSRLIEALLWLADAMGLRPLDPGHTGWATAEDSKVSLLRRHLPWMAPAAALVVIVTLLHVLWASSAQEANQSTPFWGTQTVGSVDKPSARKESAYPESTGPDRKTPLAEASKQPMNGVAEAKSSVPEAGPEKVAPQPGEAVPAPATNGGGKAPVEAAAETPVEVAQPNPLDALVSRRVSPNGLLPEAFEGGVSQGGQAPSGLSVESVAMAGRGGLSAAAGTAVEPAGAGPSAAPVPKRNHVLVVDPTGEGEGRFATLSAACGAAGDGDVIELRYTGRSEEEPIELANLELTIRAGADCKPVVGFRPSATDPIGCPRSMFTLIGSRLTLVDLAIEFDIPRDAPGDPWSLFEIGQGEKVELKECWLTIRNASDQRGAYHQGVAFFRIKGVPGAKVAVRDEPPDAARHAAVELVDCVVRGEAVCLRVEDLQPVDLIWRNGLLVTTEQLLVADGGEIAPQPGEDIRLGLEHLTAVADDGLCRLNGSEFAPHQLPAFIECANCILLLTPEASLIEQVGVTDIEQSLRRITWIGEGNVYHGFASFWTVRHIDPAIPSKPKTYDDWRSWWGLENERSPRLGEVPQEKLPPPERPAHSLTPDDYALLREATDAGTATKTDQGAEASGGAQGAGLQESPPASVPPPAAGTKPPG